MPSPSVPNMPYDNLYKFMAIFGLTLIVISLILPEISNNDLSELFSNIDEVRYEILNRKDIMEKLIAQQEEKSNSLQEEWEKILDEAENLSLKYPDQELSELVETFGDDLRRYNNSISIINSSGCYDIQITESTTTITPKQTCNTSLNPETDAAIEELKKLSQDFEQQKEKLLNAEEGLAEKEGLLAKMNETSNQIDTLNEPIDEVEELLREQQKDTYKMAYLIGEASKKLDELDDVYWKSYLLLIIGTILALFGFFLWYHKTQKLMDEIMVIDLKMKRDQLEKERPREE